MENIDCCFTEGNKYFRYKVCAIITENNHVLFAGNESVDWLYPIGGGVNHGETAEEAILREVIEETGVKYEIDRLAFIYENMFIMQGGTLKGRECHEIILYFLMKPRGSQELNSDSYCIDGKEFMKWIPIPDLPNHTAYPEWLYEKLQNFPEKVEHIITRELA